MANSTRGGITPHVTEGSARAEPHGETPSRPRGAPPFTPPSVDPFAELSGSKRRLGPAQATGGPGAPIEPAARGSRTPPARALRQAAVLDLAKRGYSAQAIAETLGINPITAGRDLKSALATFRDGIVDDAREVRTRQLAEYQELRRELWKFAVGRTDIIEGIPVQVAPNFDAVRELRMLLSAEAKLVGADVPEVRAQVVIPWDRLSATGIARIGAREDIRTILADPTSYKVLEPSDPVITARNVTPPSTSALIITAGRSDTDPAPDSSPDDPPQIVSPRQSDALPG